MSYPSRFAVLLDGGFVIQKLSERTRPRAFPSADEIAILAASLGAHDCVEGQTLLRIYFYHALPASGRLRNPVTGVVVDLSKTAIYRQSEQLLERLELRPDFALRLGELDVRDWKLGKRALESVRKTRRAIQANDFVPDIEQKGVDLRIGLDIARFALDRSVQSIIVVTGDSDLIPAFKFARREGLRVFLCPFNHGVKRELKAHADRVISVPLPPRSELHHHVPDHGVVLERVG